MNESPVPDWMLERGEPIGNVADSAFGQKLRTAVERLPEPQRAVLELRFWGNYKFAEIAERLGMNGRQNAYDYYTRGLAALRSTLDLEGPI